MKRNSEFHDVADARSIKTEVFLWLSICEFIAGFSAYVMQLIAVYITVIIQGLPPPLGPPSRRPFTFSYLNTVVVRTLRRL